MPHRALRISLDLEDEHSPIVAIMQDGEATIYLTLKEAQHLSQELAKVIKKFAARG